MKPANAPPTRSRAVYWGLAACIVICWSQFLLNWHRGPTDWLDALDVCIAATGYFVWEQRRTPGWFVLMWVAIFWMIVR